MANLALFEDDAYRTECDAEVVAAGSDGGRPWVVLSQTVLYPEGGGQPADRGWISGVAVVDVQRVGGDIRHTLASPLAGGTVHVTLDWPRRFDHMQQHTAQHLLTALAADRFGWVTTAFHLGERVSDVELAVPALAPPQLAALEEAVALEVRQARPVHARQVSAELFATMTGVRSRGLPADHSGPVRLVEIAGLDINTCGGTHVRSTAELEAVALLGTEPMRGGTRLFFVAGGRLRRRLAAHEARNAALRSALGAPDDELVAAVTARLEAQRALEKRLQHTEEELAAACARELAAAGGALAEAHFDGRELPFLQLVARAFQAHAPDRAAFLTALGTAGASFLLAAGPTSPLDVVAAGRQAADLLHGRGGGSGRLFQGKASSLAARSEVVARLRALAEPGES